MSRKVKTTMSKEGRQRMIRKTDNAIKEIKMIKINHIKFYSGNAITKLYFYYSDSIVDFN